jgi:hypothetical protein
VVHRQTFYWLIWLIFWRIFDATRDGKYSLLPLILGSIGPSVAFVIGFIPQYVLIIGMKSRIGFNRGLSILDITGSTLSIISIGVDDDSDHIDIVAMIPYFVMIACQLGLLILTTCVYRDNLIPPTIATHTNTNGTTLPIAVT